VADLLIWRNLLLLKVLLLEFLETLEVLQLLIVDITLHSALAVVDVVNLSVHSLQERYVLSFTFFELLALRVVLI